MYTGIDISHAPSERFISWLLDVALVHREESSELTPDNTVLVHMDSRLKSADIGFCPTQEMLFKVADKLICTTPKKAITTGNIYIYIVMFYNILHN